MLERRNLQHTDFQQPEVEVAFEAGLELVQLYLVGHDPWTNHAGLAELVAGQQQYSHAIETEPMSEGPSMQIDLGMKIWAHPVCPIHGTLLGELQPHWVASLAASPEVAWGSLQALYRSRSRKRRSLFHLFLFRRHL